MRTWTWTWIAVAILPAVLADDAIAQDSQLAASEVYIQQSHGTVAPGTKVQKPPPEATSAPIQGTGPTAPATCDPQNASSSQACYTATQQARPATR
jgi:hypothetical protein